MARFEIIEGKPFNTAFIIKANGTTTAVELVGDETGEFVLSTIEDNPTKVLTKSLTVGDILNGEFLLSLSDTDTQGLSYEVGFKEDGAKFKATYRANLSFYNADGSVLAHAQIPQVYIISEGV